MQLRVGTEKEERDQLKMLNSKFKIEGCWRGGLRDGQQTRKSETRHLVSYEFRENRSLCNGRRKHMISRRLGSHLINARSGEKRTNMNAKQDRPTEGTAFPSGGSFGRPLCCSSVTAPCGDAPFSRLAAGQNLSPRHLLPFMRCLPRPISTFFTPFLSCKRVGFSPVRKNSGDKRI